MHRLEIGIDLLIHSGKKRNKPFFLQRLNNCVIAYDYHSFLCDKHLFLWKFPCAQQNRMHQSEASLSSSGMSCH